MPPPRLIALAGPNGAGKSTVGPKLIRDTFGVLEFVNADAIAHGLPRSRRNWPPSPPGE